MSVDQRGEVFGRVSFEAGWITCLKLSLVAARAELTCSLHSGSAPWVALSASSIPTGAALTKQKGGNVWKMMGRGD